jgi:hypothetical protein
MRDLPQLIDKLLEIIPETEAVLRAELRCTHASASFSSPEMMSTWWNEAGMTLLQHLGTPPWEEEWKDMVSKIWRGVRL